MQKKIATTEYVDNITPNHFNFNVLGTYGITDPVEGLKKIWEQIPKGDKRPITLFLDCGNQFNCIVQATEPLYGSAIIIGYTTPSIIYIRVVNGVWI